MTKIEWTEATWNPIVGCSIVSPGCSNCYAMRMAARLEAMADATAARILDGETLPEPLSHYLCTTQPSKAGPVWTGKVAMAPDRVLTAPLRRKKPTTYFVNSMGDLFHESVPDDWIDRVFAVMALCPQHTFQVLTKRAARMRSYFTADDGFGPWGRVEGRAKQMFTIPRGKTLAAYGGRNFPHVWLGVSAERQAEADERIPDLLATPTGVRFVSCEPLLGPVDLERVLYDPSYGVCMAEHRVDVLRGGYWNAAPYRFGARSAALGAPKGGFTNHSNMRRDGHGLIDWVIVGGESGPGARPMHPDWARSLRDQCVAAGVPYFFKQWGEHECTVAAEDFAGYAADADMGMIRDAAARCEIVWPDGRRLTPKPNRGWWEGEDFDSDGDTSELTGCPVVVRRVGKRVAGRLLDGREWDDMPGAPHHGGKIGAAPQRSDELEM
jgi:protein gp37